MEFQSILFGSQKRELTKETPEFFHDLQLDYLLEKIVEPVKEYEVSPYFYVFPGSAELISYRQQVGKDMESEDLCFVIRQFCRRMQESRNMYRLSLESKGEVASATYHLQAANLYRETILLLRKDIRKLCGSFVSEGMRGFARYIEKEAERLEEEVFVRAISRANSFFSELSFTLAVEPDRITVAEKKQEDAQKNYFEDLAKLLGQEPETAYCAMAGIFPDPLEMSHLENLMVGILQKSRPQVFEEIKDFKKKFPEIYPEVLLEFEKEIQFYLCFRKFKLDTLELGYPMSLPVVGTHEFSGREVYDLALMWKQSEKEYNVVSNEFVMKETPSFFVVTGPNQGGKTTFARSLGQAVYFALMGLDVNAGNFSVPMFQGISTHFEAEEKLQSNSGKLKEEINRLVPMMKETQNQNHFVILNELFTTATTHDAMLMGRKVMESFLERQCYGIYVTHIQELAEETEQIISLVAQLEPGEETRRTYRMLPMKAQGYGYSDALVKKFNLQYEDIVRRLS